MLAVTVATETESIKKCTPIQMFYIFATKYLVFKLRLKSIINLRVHKGECCLTPQHTIFFFLFNLIYWPKGRPHIDFIGIFFYKRRYNANDTEDKIRGVNKDARYYNCNNLDRKR